MDNRKQIIDSLLSNPSRLAYETNEEKMQFIRGCEKYYNRNTKQHIGWFESNGKEGSPDDRRWYRFAIELGMK